MIHGYCSHWYGGTNESRPKASHQLALDWEKVMEQVLSTELDKWLNIEKPGMHASTPKTDQSWSWSLKDHLREHDAKHWQPQGRTSATCRICSTTAWVADEDYDRLNDQQRFAWNCIAALPTSPTSPEVPTSTKKGSSNIRTFQVIFWHWLYGNLPRRIIKGPRRIFKSTKYSRRWYNGDNKGVSVPQAGQEKCGSTV